MTDHPTMSPEQFNHAIGRLGLSAYAAAPVLGVSLRQSHRYASGETPVPHPLAKLLRLVLRLRMNVEQLAEL